MTPQEIDTMQDYEIEAHIDQWKQKQQRTDQNLAFLVSALGNIIYSSQGAKARFKPSDFLKSEKPPEPMSGDQLRNMAILAFGPPPKK